jgi:hypothetical protein
VVPVVSLILMLASWFTSKLRGALVIVVALAVKWSLFHQFSNLLNTIALAFDVVIVVPLVGETRIYIATAVGDGALLSIFTLIVTLVLGEVLPAHGLRATRRGRAVESIEGPGLGRVGGAAA